jgi:phage recombination protein Bet
MASKTVTADQLSEAVKAYCEANGKQSSQSEEKPNKITIFDGTPQPGDPMLWLEDGQLRGNDIDFCLNFAEEFIKGSKEAIKSPGKGIMPIEGRKSNGGPLVKPGGIITEEDIRNYLCPKASPQEILMAARMCQIKGMNWGDVHFIKYGDSPLTIVAGKEHFTKKAESSPQFDGYQAGIIVKTTDGYKELEGTFCIDEELVGGWAKVWRKDRKEPFVQKVKLSAFDTKKALWAKMPEVMIRKVALVNALREAFPGELGGLYDSSEMAQAGIDIDPEREVGA